MYFSVYSETATADEIAAYLGPAPDRTIVRGSRSADPPRPPQHAWHLMCDSAGLRIDEHALVLAGFALSPAVALYAHAPRHGGKEPELEHLPEAAA